MLQRCKHFVSQRSVNPRHRSARAYEEECNTPLAAIEKQLGPESERTTFGAVVGSELVGMVGVGREHDASSSTRDSFAACTSHRPIADRVSADSFCSGPCRLHRRWKGCARSSCRSPPQRRRSGPVRVGGIRGVRPRAGRGTGRRRPRMTKMHMVLRVNPTGVERTPSDRIPLDPILPDQSLTRCHQPRGGRPAAPRVARQRRPQLQHSFIFLARRSDGTAGASSSSRLCLDAMFSSPPCGASRDAGPSIRCGNLG